MPTKAVFYKGERIPGGFSNDTNVIQTEDISSNNDYEILSSGTADNTTRTEGAHKSANLTYNPSTSKMTIKDVNGSVDFSINNRIASKSMTMDESDITISGNQYWDGENQSLKTAVNTKVKKEVSNGSTSVDTYFESPYTLLSALPFGNSSLRLDDGSLFVHKDEQIESTAMVLYNNGINCYLLSVDGQTGEVTNVTGIGSWMLNQVGLSVMDVWRNGDSGWVGTDHSLANVLSSLNTSLTNKRFGIQQLANLSNTGTYNHNRAYDFIYLEFSGYGWYACRMIPSVLLTSGKKYYFNDVDGSYKAQITCTNNNQIQFTATNNFSLCTVYGIKFNW